MSGEDDQSLDPEPLRQVVLRLLEQLGALEFGEDKTAPAQSEKLAKAISLQIKALQDIETYNHTLSQERAQGPLYTAYEDFPPPSPEDHAQFIDRITRLFHKIAREEPAK